MNNQIARDLISAIKDLQAAILTLSEAVEKNCPSQKIPRGNDRPISPIPPAIKQLFAALEENRYDVYYGSSKAYVDSPHGGRVCGWHRISEYFYVPRKIGYRHEDFLNAQGFVRKRGEWILRSPHTSSVPVETVKTLTGLDIPDL